MAAAAVVIYRAGRRASRRRFPATRNGCRTRSRATRPRRTGSPGSRQDGEAFVARAAAASRRQVPLKDYGPRPTFTASRRWINTPPAHDAGAARQGRPRRLLDVLVHQLPAHAAVPEELGRALPVDRASSSSACTRPSSRSSTSLGNVRAAVKRPRHPLSGRARQRLRHVERVRRTSTGPRDYLIDRQRTRPRRPLRRRRLRRDRAGHPAAPRADVAAAALDRRTGPDADGAANAGVVPRLPAASGTTRARRYGPIARPPTGSRRRSRRTRSHTRGRGRSEANASSPDATRGCGCTSSRATVHLVLTGRGVVKVKLNGHRSVMCT